MNTVSGRLIALVALSIQVAAAQQPARLQLVRCTAGSDAPCVRMLAQLSIQERGITALTASPSAVPGWTGTLSGTVLVPSGVRVNLGSFGHGRSAVFGVGGDGAGTLARMPALGLIALHAGTDTLARVRVAWRPPLIAMPGFRGIADSSDLTPGLRDAMVVGVGDPGDRPMIALLLASILGCSWLLLYRLGGTEPAVHPRERAAGSPPSLVAPPLPAATPRRPEDITHQTARHTAMHR